MLYNQIYQGGIRALINYDPTIFDDMVLPVDEDDAPVVDLQDVVDHIIYKYGDAPLAVPDPAVIKYYIASWSKRRVSLWDRFIKAVTTEYNPLENYDRTEKSGNEYTPGSTREMQVSADNATTYQPEAKEINSGKDSNKFDSHIHGNIGVTTSQQMLASELDIIPRLDIIDMIADDWHDEFNLLIYN